MASYSTPGVFVEEVSTLPNSVVQVATAVPGFVGYTEVDPGKPLRISSMLEFVAQFGGPYEYTATKSGLELQFATDTNGITTLTSVAELNNKIKFNLYYSMQMYFANGGGACWVASALEYDDSDLSTASIDQLNDGLKELAKIDEVTLLVIPDAVNLTTGALFGSLMDNALAQCNTLQDRFVIMDTYESVDLQDGQDVRNDIGANNLKYGAVYFPHLISNYTYSDSEVKVVAHTGSGNAPVNMTDSPYDNIAALKEEAETDSDAAEMLAEVLPLIQAAVKTKPIVLPPSGAIAGVYCAMDRNRGVWKAPANVSLTALQKPTVKITAKNQELLNVDTSGKSINAIRTFTGKGHLVYGARTLDGNSSEWRYVPVRRLYINVEESIKKASQFAVFEPNDANTWTKLKAMIENFLSGLWRQGALAGSTPDQAYFVNVGLGSTMTPQDILEGNLIIEVGMAAVRPAEFIILKFSHKLQEA